MSNQPINQPVELLPCPFCGSDRIRLIQSAAPWFWHKCIDCGTEGPNKDTGTAALEAWQTRSPQPAPTEPDAVAECLDPRTFCKWCDRPRVDHVAFSMRCFEPASEAPCPYCHIFTKSIKCETGPMYFCHGCQASFTPEPAPASEPAREDEDQEPWDTIADAVRHMRAIDKLSRRLIPALDAKEREVEGLREKFTSVCQEAGRLRERLMTAAKALNRDGRDVLMKERDQLRAALTAATSELDRARAELAAAKEYAARLEERPIARQLEKAESDLAAERAKRFVSALNAYEKQVVSLEEKLAAITRERDELRK